MKDKINQDPEIEKQFNEISNYILGCSFNPLGNDGLSTNPEFTFVYDIKQWLSDFTNKTLHQFQFPHRER